MEMQPSVLCVMLSYVTVNNKIHLGFHVKCLNQICTFSTDFHNCPQHQIPQSSGSHTDTSGKTDRHPHNPTPHLYLRVT